MKLSVIDAKAMLRQHEQKTATTNLPARRMLNSAIARGATSLDAAVVRDVWAGLSGGGMAERDALKVELAALDEKLKVLEKKINDKKEKIKVLEKCDKEFKESIQEGKVPSGETIIKCNRALSGRLAAQEEQRAKAIEEKLADMKGLLADLEKQKGPIEEKVESIQKDLAKDLEKLEDTAKSMGEEGGWCSIM